MFLIFVFAGLLFVSCEDDDDPLMKTTAEQIAEQILDYGAQDVCIYSSKSRDFQNVPFEIKIPFLIVKDDDNDPHFFFLENILYMYYINSMDLIVLHFK